MGVFRSVSVYGYDDYGGSHPNCVLTVRPEGTGDATRFPSGQYSRGDPGKKTDFLTHSPVLFSHVDRMAPAMDTDRSLRKWMTRETPVTRPTRTELDSPTRLDIVFAFGPDSTGDRNQPLTSEQDGLGGPGEKTDPYQTECGDLFASVVSAGGTGDDC